MTKTTPGAMRATKGPWKIEADFFIRAKEDGRAICEVNQEFRHYGMPARSDIEQVDMANARLIAASPAMLEALQAVVEGRIDHLRPNLFGCNECRQSAKLRAQIPHRELCHVGKCEAAISAATGEGKIG